MCFAWRVCVLLGGLIGNGGFMGCGFAVCVFCLVVVVGCLRGREREREIIIIKKNKKLYLNKVAPNKKKGLGC